MKAFGLFALKVAAALIVLDLVASVVGIDILGLGKSITAGFKKPSA